MRIYETLLKLLEVQHETDLTAWHPLQCPKAVQDQGESQGAVCCDNARRKSWRSCCWFWMLWNQTLPWLALQISLPQIYGSPSSELKTKTRICTMCWMKYVDSHSFAHISNSKLKTHRWELVQLQYITQPIDMCQVTNQKPVKSYW